jgi:hypothetical protein
MIQTTLPFFFSVILHPFRKITGHSSVKEDVEAALVESEKGEVIPHAEIQKRYKKWLAK